MNDYERLREFASPRQREIIDAVIKEGSQGRAAEFLGLGRRSVERALARARYAAAKRGWAPEYGQTKPVPTGQVIRGVSTQYDRNGDISQQWVKTKQDDDLQHAYEAFQEFAAAYEGYSKAPQSLSRSASRDLDERLLSVYPLGDPHVGMYAWGEETGEDFDIQIVEEVMLKAIHNLVAVAPPSHQAVIINLGDFFHTDWAKNVTVASGNQLDVDTRYPKIIQIGLMIMVAMIDMALTKHKKVKVIICIGNHDETSSVWLGVSLDAWYRNNDRVEVVIPKGMFTYHQHGAVLLGATHGHTTKPDKLPMTMARDCREIWSSTRFWRWYTGHVHHESVKEYAGVVVETFRTLAGRDSWHHGRAYRSDRDMRVDIWHDTKGWRGRRIETVESLYKD